MTKSSKKAAKAAKHEEQIVKSHSIVPLRWKIAYELTKLPGTCGDRMAIAFAEQVVNQETETLDLAALRAVGKQNGIDVQARWGARNPGQQRMNLGNVLRGMQRRGETVLIGKQSFRGDKQPAAKAKPAKATKAKAAKQEVATTTSEVKAA